MAPPSFVDSTILQEVAPPPPLPPALAASESVQAPRRRAAGASAWRQEPHPAVLLLSQATGLALLAGAGYGVWKWWSNRAEGNAGGSSGASSSQAQPNKKGLKPGDKGYASNFSFDRNGKPKKGAQEPVSAVQAIPMRSMPNTSSAPQPKVSGNAKKNKRVKQSRKEAKKAKEREAAEADNAAAIIAARAKAKGIADAGKTPDVGLVSTVSFEKNADAFHHVMQWQESGKKEYR